MRNGRNTDTIIAANNDNVSFPYKIWSYAKDMFRFAFYMSSLRDEEKKLKEHARNAESNLESRLKKLEQEAKSDLESQLNEFAKFKKSKLDKELETIRRETQEKANAVALQEIKLNTEKIKFENDQRKVGDLTNRANNLDLEIKMKSDKLKDFCTLENILSQIDIFRSKLSDLKDDIKRYGELQDLLDNITANKELLETQNQSIQVLNNKISELNKKKIHLEASVRNISVEIESKTQKHVQEKLTGVQQSLDGINNKLSDLGKNFGIDIDILNANLKLLSEQFSSKLSSIESSQQQQFYDLEKTREKMKKDLKKEMKQRREEEDRKTEQVFDRVERAFERNNVPSKVVNITNPVINDFRNATLSPTRVDMTFSSKSKDRFSWLQDTRQKNISNTEQTYNDGYGGGFIVEEIDEPSLEYL